MSWPSLRSFSRVLPFSLFFFFFNDTATTEIYTLSLHDALPICLGQLAGRSDRALAFLHHPRRRPKQQPVENHRQRQRSEEHTSELQSLAYLVCRLLLEKKKKKRRRAEQQQTT